MPESVRNANIFEAFIQGIIVLDENGIVIESDKNAAYLLNTRLENLLGTDLRMILRPYFRDEVHLNHFLSPEAEGETELIIPFETENESRLKLLTIVNSTLHGNERERGRVVLNILDISRFAEIENQLQRKIDEFSMLNSVYTQLHSAEKVSDVITATLVAVTAGSGLRYNRAYLFIVDKEKPILKGKLAVGPALLEKAGEIWDNLDRSNYTLQELIDLSKRREFLQNNRELTQLCQGIVVPLNDTDHFLIRCMKRPHSCVLTRFDSQKGLLEFMNRFNTEMIAVAPLHGRFNILGVLVVDNAVTRYPIYEDNLHALQTFANQAAIAIENMFLYTDLQEKNEELDKSLETLKKNQQQLVRLERFAAVGEVTTRLAHEIRNPLASIGGFVEVLEKALKKDPDTLEYVQIIKEEIHRLEKLLNNILTFVRPEKDLHTGASLNEIIRANIYLLSKRLEEANVKAQIDLDDRLQKINITDYEVTQLVLNLVKNAIEAMPDGGTLLVKTEVKDDKVFLIVSDTGMGIEEERKELLFEPYFTTKPDGTGIGLTVCNQIVSGNRGEIRIYSEPGKGTTFEIIFPGEILLNE